MTTAPRSAIVRLDVGEPDVPTPEHVVEAGVRAMRDGATRYVPSEGVAPLRGAVAEQLRARGHDAAAERVIVTSGAKPMLVCAMLALLRPGDEALVPDPGYPGYRHAAALAGATTVPYAVLGAGGRFALDAAAIAARIGPRTRVLVINSPHNPTGGVASARELDAVAELALRHDLFVVSDEVYAAIVFDGDAPDGIGTRPEMAGRTVTIDSFSKTYAMTGWRLGYGLVPAALVPRLRALVAATTTCTPEFVQRAGIAALEGPQGGVREMVERYRVRREAMLAALATVSEVSVATPAGAFYVFPRFSGPLGADSEIVATRLLHAHGLACVPGAAYGRCGEGHLRLTFAASAEQVADGAARLAAFVAGGRARSTTP